MKREYTPPPPGKPPARREPSASYRGETATAVIHEAVGRALSSWEHAESALIKLFQLLCETKSLAACRAYGTLESVFAKKLALKYAAEEFFLTREEKDLSLVSALLKDYFGASEYRNQVAHGMAVQPHDFGYSLCPPSYASRRQETPYPAERWALGAKYFYRVAEIDQINARFEQILAGTMSLVLFLNEKYSVLPYEALHP